LLRFMPAGWAEILRIRVELPLTECDKMDMTGTLEKVIEAGRIPIGAIPYTGEWGEVDSVEDLAVFNMVKV